MQDTVANCLDIKLIKKTLSITRVKSKSSVEKEKLTIRPEEKNLKVETGNEESEIKSETAE